MGQKVHPTALRLGSTTNWKSRWLFGRNFRLYLRQDVLTRKFLEKRLRGSAVDAIEIERTPSTVTVIVRTARPGLVIGRGGGGIEALRKDLLKILTGEGHKTEVKLQIEEFRHPETSARITGEMIAEQLEKRLPYRRVLKQALDKMLANKEVRGAKIQISGRIGGAEISRREFMKRGSLPLQTLRAVIDHAQVNAYTTFGVIGIKVWIYKGEVFQAKEDAKKTGRVGL